MTDPNNQDTPVARQWRCVEDGEERTGWKDIDLGDLDGWARYADKHPGKVVIEYRSLYSSDQFDRMRERAERAEAERADEWRARREEEASRDTALAVAATFRAERDELRAVAIKAQAVLAMFVAPDAIKQTTVINAYAAAVEAETALRTLLTKLQDTSHE